MLNKIKNYFRELKINRDFVQYEELCRKELIRLADVRFLPQEREIELELKRLGDKVKFAAQNKYDSEISKARAEKGLCQLLIDQTQVKFIYFSRNYSDELNEQYEKINLEISNKKALFEKRSDLKAQLPIEYENKKNAYADLEYYKGQVSNWYAKSNSSWLLGNKGKKIPQHSFFGQSFGDLDSYKSKRDSAYSDLNHAKWKIESIKNELEEIKDGFKSIATNIENIYAEINQVKIARNKMYELKAEGFRKTDLKLQLDTAYLNMGKLEIAINKVNSEKNLFERNLKLEFGFSELEHSLSNIAFEKNKFLRAFDFEESRIKRKKIHRESWLKKHT